MWVGGRGGMGEGDNRPPSPVIYVRAMSCSKVIEAHRLHLLSGFSS